MAKRFLRIHLLLVAALILPLPNQAGMAQTGASDDFHLYLPLITNLGENNIPPGMPANPSPADQATGQAISNLILSWSGADPDGDAVTYSVYLDANSSNPTSMISADQAATQFTVGSLSPTTSYAWKVVARDSRGATTSGPVWRFITGGGSGPLPSVDVKVNGSDGPVILTDQDSFTVSWTSTNATACTGSGAMAGRTGASGSFTDGPKANGTYSYIMTCTNGQGQQASDSITVTVVEPLPIESQPITAGTYHTCALTQAGAAKCWGDNRDGQLGDGTSEISDNSPTPVGVVGLASGVSAITAGDHHTCALTQAGGVKCWGYNYYGQLGDGTSDNSRETPVNVAGLASGVSAIAAGDHHTCALTQTGEIYCWGSNGDGELGIGDYTISPIPAQVVGLPGRVSAITAGGNHTCALTQAGGVYCWGENEAGELGDGTTTGTPTPVQVAGLASGMSAIAAGDDHTCALTQAGGVKCWGGNDYGQLGDGTLDNSPFPVQVAGLASGMSAIAAGDGHTCALTQAGGAKCWGDGSLGQLGESGWSNKTTPVDVFGLTSGVSAIAAGYIHTCALTQAGGAKCWGDNDYGQLGTGIYWTAFIPEDVVGFP